LGREVLYSSAAVGHHVRVLMDVGGYRCLDNIIQPITGSGLVFSSKCVKSLE
jgi:hypothetical protein